MTDFFGYEWWLSGAALSWYDSNGMALAGRRPAWLPGRDEATNCVTRQLDRVAEVIGLVHSFRTLETKQLNRLAPGTPDKPAAMLYRSLAALGLIDLGFPMTFDGRPNNNPMSADWMALRLPVDDIAQKLLDLGMNPVQVSSLSASRALRSQRQYDRHNLLTVEAALPFLDLGWSLVGEGWSRFDLLYDDDSIDGSGSPDVTLVRPDGFRVCIELTASGSFLAGKVSRWQNHMDKHPYARTQVVWLLAGRGDKGQRMLESKMRSAFKAADTAQPVALWEDWFGPDGQIGRCHYPNGETFDVLTAKAQPGPTWKAPTDPGRDALMQAAAAYGLDASGWGTPQGLTAAWHGGVAGQPRA